MKTWKDNIMETVEASMKQHKESKKLQTHSEAQSRNGGEWGQSFSSE